MQHYTPLIGTICAGLVAAFIMGSLAQKLRVSPVAGYLLGGVLVGPFTPGFVADLGLAQELAEIGVILLMFGVGLHFSLKDLLSVRRIAVPGAIVQIAAATLMGMGLGWSLGWDPIAGFVFGLSLSVASTVVLLRALQARNLVNTERGRIAVGWLIVEDLVMVLALVLLPAIATAIAAPGGGFSTLAWPLLAALIKVVGFMALMLIVGRRVIPWALHWVAHTGSRELFRLAVLAIALGIAFGAAVLFDVSFALGAFFAGMILGESRLSQRAAEETLPLRDAFAVLFFVSVGMLFNPAVIIEQPVELAATVAIIVFGKSLAALLLVRAFGYPRQTGLTVSASLAQIGEFSFILVGLGVSLNLLPAAGRDLVLAGAILSILIHPFLFSAVERSGVRKAKRKAERDGHDAAMANRIVQEQPLDSHVILIGYGRVGRLLGAGLRARARRFVVVEEQNDVAEQARREGGEVIVGSACDPAVMQQAGLARAAKLLIAIPEGFDGGQIAAKARTINPDIVIIARAHSDAAVEHLEKLGARHVVMGEREIAAKMLQHAASVQLGKV